MKLAFVKTITNNKVIVICPHCNKEHTITRNHTIDGEYVHQCPDVSKFEDNRFKYIVDREGVFK